MDCGGDGFGGAINVAASTSYNVASLTMRNVTFRRCSSDVGGALGSAGTVSSVESKSIL